MAGSIRSGRCRLASGTGHRLIVLCIAMPLRVQPSAWSRPPQNRYHGARPSLPSAPAVIRRLTLGTVRDAGEPMRDIARSYNRAPMTRTISTVLLALFTMTAPSQAAPSIPNDCWFGAMIPDKAPHGQLVATGPVTEWRVGKSLVLYTTKESYEQIDALAEKGETGTFDTSRPITVIPIWIAGPEPGDEDSGEEKSIEIMMQYRTDQGGTGTIDLTYWTPKSSSLPPDQQATAAGVDQQLHDTNCRGIP